MLDLATKVTDELRLDAAISEAEQSGTCQLVIVASGYIKDLHFNVGLEIIDLKVYRCSMNQEPQEYLEIDGLSMYRELPIQFWEAIPHRSKFWLGPGVVIRVDPRKCGWRIPCNGASEKWELDREALRSYVDQMNNIKMEGNWWNEFKGPIAAILRIIAGAATFTSATCIKMSAAGAFVQYKFVGDVLKGAAAVGGTKAGAALGATAAGSALLVASGVAAAIYFIPWESIFDWLNTIVSWLRIKIESIWEKIKSWLAACVNMIRDSLKSKEELRRPLIFPA